MLSQLEKVVDQIARDAAIGELVDLIRLLDGSPADTTKAEARDLIIGRLIGLLDGRGPVAVDPGEAFALTNKSRFRGYEQNRIAREKLNAERGICHANECAHERNNSHSHGLGGVWPDAHAGS